MSTPRDTHRIVSSLLAAVDSVQDEAAICKSGTKLEALGIDPDARRQKFFEMINEAEGNLREFEARATARRAHQERVEKEQKARSRSVESLLPSGLGQVFGLAVKAPTPKATSTKTSVNVTTGSQTKYAVLVTSAPKNRWSVSQLQKKPDSNEFTRVKSAIVFIKQSSPQAAERFLATIAKGLEGKIRRGAKRG